MVECSNKAGVAGYASIFDQVTEGWKKEGCVSVHSIELPYVFGDWDDTTGCHFTGDFNSISDILYEGGSDII